MKQLFFSLTALILSAGVFAQAKSDDLAKFKTETIDQGKIMQNTPEVATFMVTNTGSKDLIIEQANPTCGCTIGDFTKTPIKPGQSGQITAKYNAAGLGAYEKHMTVKFAGAEDMKSITIKGEVLSPEDYAKYKASTPATMAKLSTTATPVKMTTTTVKAKKGKKLKTKVVTAAS